MVRSGVCKQAQDGKSPLTGGQARYVTTNGMQIGQMTCRQVVKMRGRYSWGEKAWVGEERHGSRMDLRDRYAEQAKSRRAGKAGCMVRAGEAEEYRVPA